MNLANVGVAACKAAVGGALRTKRVRLLAALATYLGALVTPACADGDWIVDRMSGSMRPETTWEQVRSQMLTAFFRAILMSAALAPKGSMISEKSRWHSDDRRPSRRSWLTISMATAQ